MTAARPAQGTDSLHLPAGTAAGGPYALEVTPESAGWGHSGLRVLELPAGGDHTLDTGADEVVVVPLEGGLTVECENEVLTLAGRSGVFAGPTDFAYLPMGATAELHSRDGGRFALCSARGRIMSPEARSRKSAARNRLRGDEWRGDS